MHHKCIIDHEITSYAINIAEYQLMRLDKFSMHTNAYSDRKIGSDMYTYHKWVLTYLVR